MIISRVRKALNDSYIGRKINSSKLGLIVESISKDISDPLWEARFNRAYREWEQIQRAMYSIPYEKRDWTKINRFPVKEVNDKYMKKVRV